MIKPSIEKHEAHGRGTTAEENAKIREIYQLNRVRRERIRTARSSVGWVSETKEPS